MKTEKQIITEIKNELGLDFRSDVYLENQYGCGPCYNYDLGKKVVIFVRAFLADFLKKNQERFPYFSGWEWNLDMDIESLRTTKLKDYIGELICELFTYETEQYRFNTGSLFEYDSNSDSYIHVFKNARCNTKAKAIKEYENGF